jgi:hypothetical protein
MLLTKDWTLGVRGFDSRWELRILFFSTASRPALRPTQPPIQWVSGALSPRVKRPGRKTDLLVQRLEMRGAIPPPQYIFMAWCLVKHRNYFTFAFKVREGSVRFVSLKWIWCFWFPHVVAHDVPVQYHRDILHGHHRSQIRTQHWRRFQFHSIPKCIRRSISWFRSGKASWLDVLNLPLFLVTWFSANLHNLVYCLIWVMLG